MSTQLDYQPQSVFQIINIKILFLTFSPFTGKYWRYSLGANPAGEVYGYTSQCVVGKVSKVGFSLPAQDKALCYKVECSADRKTITWVLDGNTKVSCNSAGSTVTLPNPYTGYLQCPDPSIYCKISE
jgi:hypothetical protein